MQDTENELCSRKKPFTIKMYKLGMNIQCYLIGVMICHVSNKYHVKEK